MRPTHRNTTVRSVSSTNSSRLLRVEVPGRGRARDPLPREPADVHVHADFHALAFGPTEPDVVFFGHHNGVMRSQDGGRT